MQRTELRGERAGLEYSGRGAIQRYGAAVFCEPDPCRRFSVILDNQDASVPHNFSLYADRGYTQSVFTGELDNGPATKTYTFDAPSTPGAYFFRCDVHPDTMTGQFTIN
jgi:hypothetical protein